MNFSDPAKDRVKWLTGAPPPTRKIMQSDGTVTVEKLNPMRAKLKFVDVHGVVAEASLATGYAITSTNTDYAQMVKARILKDGGLPYAECPLATGRVPAAKGDKPCAGTFTDKQCCPHMEQIIAARKAKHAEHEAEFAAGMMTNADKQVAAFERMLKMNTTAPAAPPKGFHGAE